MYLPTTDAVGYLGVARFQRGGRVWPPAAIRETRQFRELCVDSATLMCRDIKLTSSGAVIAVHSTEEP